MKQHETQGDEVLSSEVITPGAVTLSPSSLILTPRILPFHSALHMCFYNSFVNDKRFLQINENIFTFQACFWN